MKVDVVGDEVYHRDNERMLLMDEKSDVHQVDALQWGI